MHATSDQLSRRLAALSEMRDAAGMRAQALSALELLGIRGVYFLAPLSEDRRSDTVVRVSGLPEVWERHYRAGLHRIDPLPQIALRQPAGFAWPDAIDPAYLSERQQRFLAIAARHGLARGIGAAC